MSHSQKSSVIVTALMAGGVLAPAHAQQQLQQQPLPPFTRTLSNTTPLAFGMSAEDTATALGSSLTYVSGRPGDEIFMVIRNAGGSGFSFRNDPLYLQFRGGRLTGWKGDWDRRWMWK
jgi:hypothetical protein